MRWSGMVVAAHGGRVLGATGTGPGGVVGVVTNSTALPIGFRDQEGGQEDGFRGLWEATGDLEAMFRVLDLEYLDAPGVWVLTARWEDQDTDPDWGHLWGPSTKRIGLVAMWDLLNQWGRWEWPGGGRDRE